LRGAIQKKSPFSFCYFFFLAKQKEKVGAGGQVLRAESSGRLYEVLHKQ
jgi:hypothetical protein